VYLTIINVMNKEKLLKELVEEIKKDEKLRQEFLKALQSEHSERKPRKNYEEKHNEQARNYPSLFTILRLYLPATIVFTGWGVLLLWFSTMPSAISIFLFPVGLIALFIGISVAIDMWKLIKHRKRYKVVHSRRLQDILFGFLMRG